MTTLPNDIKITLPYLDLNMAEHRLITEALLRTETLVEAAALLGTSRQVLRRLISKHSIEWWPHAQRLESWRRRAHRKRARANASAEASLRLSLRPVLSPAPRSPDLREADGPILDEPRSRGSGGHAETEKGRRADARQRAKSDSRRPTGQLA